MISPLFGIALAAAIVTSQPEHKRTLYIAVRPDQFESQVLISEYKRNGWPLQGCRDYVIYHFDVKLVDWIHAAPEPKKYPAYAFNKGDWEYFEPGDFMASGQAIQALHRVSKPWVEARYVKQDYPAWIRRRDAERKAEAAKQMLNGDVE